MENLKTTIVFIHVKRIRIHIIGTTLPGTYVCEVSDACGWDGDRKRLGTAVNNPPLFFSLLCEASTTTTAQ